MRRGFLVFLAVFQTILLFAHLVMLLTDEKTNRYGLSRRAVGWRVDCLGDMGGFSPAWCHMCDQYPQQIILSGMQDAWQKAPVSFEARRTNPVCRASWSAVVVKRVCKVRASCGTVVMGSPFRQSGLLTQPILRERLPFVTR